MRLVVGGGRAPDYPRLRARDLSVDIAPSAEPHIVADVRRLPIASSTVRAVFFECIPYPAITTADGAGLCEAMRVLRPGGWVHIVTGIHAPLDDIRTTLRDSGMECITVESGNGGPLSIRARKRGHRELVELPRLVRRFAERGLAV